MKAFLRLVLLGGLMALPSSYASAQNFAQMVKLIESGRSNPSAVSRGASDNFGYSVAISGDYVIVAAYQDAEDAGGLILQAVLVQPTFSTGVGPCGLGSKRA